MVIVIEPANNLYTVIWLELKTISTVVDYDNSTQLAINLSQIFLVVFIVYLRTLVPIESFFNHFVCINQI